VESLTDPVALGILALGLSMVDVVKGKKQLIHVYQVFHKTLYLDPSEP